jgi:hypothetical protein
MVHPDPVTTSPEAGRPAVEVLEAALVARRGGRLLRGARYLVTLAVQLFTGAVAGPSLSDVVVTRRDDGTEVLRVPAGDPTVPGDMLRVVQRQLEELDVATFLAEWAPKARD